MAAIDTTFGYIDRDRMSAIVGRALVPEYAVIVNFTGGTRPSIKFTLCGREEEISSRNRITVDYIRYILSHSAAENKVKSKKESNFIFQGDDRPVDVESIAWQSKHSFLKIGLVPDFYYVSARGYVDFYSDPPLAWNARQSTVLWRGSTTGAVSMSIDDLRNLTRYKLCRAGSKMASQCDFGFTSVVQMVNSEEALKAQEILREENIIKTYIPLEEYCKYKYFVQAPGNGSSWELVRKLRLGCCMLLVDTDWLLWHDMNLQPWIHYVPVSADLVDLAERIDWCFCNDESASKIAQNGRDLALQINFANEMGTAAQIMLDHNELI